MDEANRRIVQAQADHPEPDVWMFRPTPGERFVVCSDGLSGELDDRDITLLARRHPDPQDAAPADTAPRAGLRRP